VFPSWQLIVAVLGVDILATIFALFGWLSGPAVHGGWIDIVTVVKIWGYSIGVTVVLLLVCEWGFVSKLGSESHAFCDNSRLDAPERSHD